MMDEANQGGRGVRSDGLDRPLKSRIVWRVTRLVLGAKDKGEVCSLGTMGHPIHWTVGRSVGLGYSGGHVWEKRPAVHALAAV